MIYFNVKLNCFKEIQMEARQILNDFDCHEFYVIRPLSLSLQTITNLNTELAHLGLPKVGPGMAFKRKNCRIQDRVVSKYTHIDSNSQGIITKVSLIIPVEGCLDTHMYYFDGDYRSDTTIINNISTTKLHWTSEPKIIDKISVVDCPVIAKVDIPHDADSRLDGSYRSVVTFRFDNNPDIDTIYESYLQNKRTDCEIVQ